MIVDIGAVRGGFPGAIASRVGHTDVRKIASIDPVVMHLIIVGVSPTQNENVAKIAALTHPWKLPGIYKLRRTKMELKEKMEYIDELFKQCSDFFEGDVLAVKLDAYNFIAQLNILDFVELFKLSDCTIQSLYGDGSFPLKLTYVPRDKNYHVISAVGSDQYEGILCGKYPTLDKFVAWLEHS